MWNVLKRIIKWTSAQVSQSWCSAASQSLPGWVVPERGSDERGGGCGVTSCIVPSTHCLSTKRTTLSPKCDCVIVPWGCHKKRKAGGSLSVGEPPKMSFYWTSNMQCCMQDQCRHKNHQTHRLNTNAKCLMMYCHMVSKKFQSKALCTLGRLSPTFFKMFFDVSLCSYPSDFCWRWAE